MQKKTQPKNMNTKANKTRRKQTPNKKILPQIEKKQTNQPTNHSDHDKTVILAHLKKMWYIKEQST